MVARPFKQKPGGIIALLDEAWYVFYVLIIIHTRKRQTHAIIIWLSFKMEVQALDSTSGCASRKQK